MIIIKFFIFSTAITFLSWIIAMLTTPILMKSPFYQKELSNMNFIKNEKINTVFGVGITKWFVKNTFFKYFNPRLQLSNKARLSDLRLLREEMTKSEVDHLIGFAYVLFFALIKICNQEYFFGAILFLTNTVMNLYPSLLQQQNKRRIDRLLNQLWSATTNSIK